MIGQEISSCYWLSIIAMIYLFGFKTFGNCFCTWSSHILCLFRLAFTLTKTLNPTFFVDIWCLLSSVGNRGYSSKQTLRRILFLAALWVLGSFYIVSNTLNDIIIDVHCSANLYYQSYHFHLFYMMQQKRHFVATKNGKCCPKGAQAGWRGGALPKRI